MVDTGLHNVQSTLFAWLYQQLLTYKPSSISTVVLRPEWPEDPITDVLPMWSVIILGVDEDTGFQGGHTGGTTYGNMQYGIAQIDCWSTRRITGWVQQLAQMQDAVVRSVNVLRATGSGLVIRDFDTNVSAPAATAYRMTIDRVERSNAPIDPNPDIQRKRILLFFHWVERN